MVLENVIITVATRLVLASPRSAAAVLDKSVAIVNGVRVPVARK